MTQQLSTTLRAYIQQLENIINDGSVTERDLQHYQKLVDDIDQKMNGSISDYELSQLYEIQALILAAQGRSRKSDDFIYEALSLVDDRDDLNSENTKDYLYQTLDNKKSSPTKLPSVLTNDKKVLSSMKWIQRAGFWTAGVGVLLIVASIFYSIMAFETYIPFMLVFIPLAVFLIVSGQKMNAVEGGNVILWLLIINIPISIILVQGLFPILMLITSIIALAKIRHYRRWWKMHGRNYDLLSRRNIGNN